jgi:hypothetical protein
MEGIIVWLWRESSGGTHTPTYRTTQHRLKTAIRVVVAVSRGATKAGISGYSPPPTKPPQSRNLKNTDFVDIMIPKVLRDLPFSRNQPLKSADD